MAELAWRQRFESEIHRGELARSQGLEGRARVCARRAAGVVLQEFQRHKVPSSTVTNAYDLIRFYSESPDIVSEARDILRILLVRVSQGGVFPLPQDLLELVSRLPTLLINNDSPGEG